MTSELTASEIARRGEVRRIGAEHREGVVDLLAEAYRDDPIVNWTLGAGPGVDLDDDAHRRYWRGVIAGVAPGSETHATYDVDAVAVWRPHSGGESGATDGFDLVAVAVAPSSRGAGLARRVLAPMIDRADRRGLVLTARAVSGPATALTTVGGTVMVGSDRLAPDGPVVVSYRREPVVM